MCNCSSAGAASWQPQYAGQPAAYPGAYAPPYSSSPYVASTGAASSQSIAALLSQLTVLMQALQGVAANLQAGLPGNFGFPSAYSGYQQMAAPAQSYPSQGYAQQQDARSYAPPLPALDPTSRPTPAPAQQRRTAPEPAPARTREPVETPPIPSDSKPKPTPAPAPAPTPAPAQNQGPKPVKPMGELAPNAWRDPNGLSEQDKQGVCGPVAAIAFVRATGREMSIDEAVRIARPTGWSSAGMNGPDHEVRLLDAMGVKTVKEDKVDWEKVKREVAAGRPVIIDTPEHYYVVEGFNAETGEFNFGQTAAIKGDHNGKTWLKPQELDLAGGARSAIYLG